MLLIIFLSVMFAILTVDDKKLKLNLKLNKIEIIYLICTVLMGIGTERIRKVLLTTYNIQFLPILLAISIGMVGTTVIMWIVLQNKTTRHTMYTAVMAITVAYILFDAVLPAVRIIFFIYLHSVDNFTHRDELILSNPPVQHLPNCQVFLRQSAKFFCAKLPIIS